MDGMFDSDFFKSVQLQENGMLKSIPKMPGAKIIDKPKKKIPKEVKNYIEEMEEAFKIVDKCVSEVCEERGKEKCVELLEHYSKFKYDLQYCVNDLINYSNKIKEEYIPKDQEKTRVDITNKI